MTKTYGGLNRGPVEVTEIAKKVFNDKAEAYEAKFMDTQQYHEEFNLLISKLPPGAKILDAGTGPGNILHYFLAHRPDLICTGIDVAPKMLQLAGKNNPAADFLLLDARQITSTGAGYACIIAGFIFPYFSREEISVFITDGANMLLPGGLLYVSTMERNYSTSGLEVTAAGNKLFIYYHEEEFLRGILMDRGFTVIHASRKSTEDSFGKPVTDLVMIGQLKD